MHDVLVGYDVTVGGYNEPTAEPNALVGFRGLRHHRLVRAANAGEAPGGPIINAAPTESRMAIPDANRRILALHMRFMFQPPPTWQEPQIGRRGSSEPDA
jgi:hypothetical protein